MYLSKIVIENFRCFGENDQGFALRLRPGLTALVGENDAGKTAVIDAIRFVLGTTDQDWWPRLEDTDFHERASSREIKIICTFEGLTARDKRAFIEYLTYGESPGDPPVFHINWTAKDTGEQHRGRPYRRIEVRSGKNGDGPTLAPEVRELLRATYLRPLRDADQALSAGRGSRLCQVLRHSNLTETGDSYRPDTPLEEQTLSVLGIGKLLNGLLAKQSGVITGRTKIDENLQALSLRGDSLTSSITVSSETAPESICRELLEKLDLRLTGGGRPGLGSNNLLFIACELLLLDEETEGYKLLLIEEPESHLHAQRQLRAMKYLQQQASASHIQIIVTTHSPNLASVIKLDNMVIIRQGRAFALAEGETELEPSDYRFLERFLDVTKANLFFARGVMIVEGDAENILLPTLATLIERDFTEHGVSIVNVGGVGLRRYARIFQRRNVKDDESGQHLQIPVACVTDMDVMPDCAPFILGKLKQGADWRDVRKRRWQAKRDLSGEELLESRKGKELKASGQRVKTFVSDEWTLEYDLALGPRDENGRFTGGIAEDVYVAACMADDDEAIHAGKKAVADVQAAAEAGFVQLEQSAKPQNGCTVPEVVASQVYAKLVRGKVSKPIVAQYLAERLDAKHAAGEITAEHLRNCLPTYLVRAIDYVTRAPAQTQACSEAGVSDG